MGEYGWDAWQHDLAHGVEFVITFRCKSGEYIDNLCWFDLGHTGTVCSSFSLACHPAVRGPGHLYGWPKSHLMYTPGRRMKAKLGNSIANFSIDVLEACATVTKPMSLENPKGSHLWRTKRYREKIALALRDDNTGVWQFITTYYCSWGCKYQKVTSLLCCHAPYMLELQN